MATAVARRLGAGGTAQVGSAAALPRLVPAPAAHLCGRERGVPALPLARDVSLGLRASVLQLWGGEDKATCRGDLLGGGVPGHQCCRRAGSALGTLPLGPENAGGHPAPRKAHAQGTGGALGLYRSLPCGRAGRPATSLFLKVKFFCLILKVMDT